MSAVSNLDRKLLRDLWRLKLQVLAIACIVASGAALLIMALTTIEALEETTDAYYERHRFADVFARVKRAPAPLVREIAAIPGVQATEARIEEIATLEVAGYHAPIVGSFLSLSEKGPPLLNLPALRSGDMPDPRRPDEVVISEPFAEAHGLTPGDEITAVLRGRKRVLRIVGTALSPEYVYAIPPGGLMPDDERFGVVWMGRKAMAAAYDLEESFNSLTLRLMRGADANDVIARLDTLLAPYGGNGAFARADQVSNWFLQNEIQQQKNMSRLMPTIFLAVAAFLTNMVMARLITTERHEIGLLKAFGFTNGEVGWHYAKMVLFIGTLGVLLGAAVGAALGRWNTEIYAEFYRFPFLLYRPGPSSFAIAAIVSLAATLSGSLGAVWRAVSLPPSVAMQPAPPPSFRRDWLSRTRLARALDEPTRMIFRRLMRWPLRAFLTSAGLAMSVAVLVMALQWNDAVETLAESFFVEGQHQDATLTFNEIQPAAALRSVERLPGVFAAEPFRGVAARFRNGHLHTREALQGVPAGARLSPVHDSFAGRVDMPPGGLVISSQLAGVLGVGVGDSLRVQVLEGRRPDIDMPVVRVFDTYIGKPAYIELSALNRLMGDGRVIGGAHLAVDAALEQAFLAELTDVPNVAAILFRAAAIDEFYDTMGETVLIFIGFFVAFATTLSVGVTYNSVRIALSERARELATLRVLGFSKWEISYILLGEIGVVTWLAMPLGCVTGYLLAWYLNTEFATELFRVPMVVADVTYGKSVLIALASTGLCAVLLRRRLDRLDLISVLKTRE